MSIGIKYGFQSPGCSLFEHWTSDSSVSIQKPATQQEIFFFERKNKIVIPNDFKNYLLFVNGFNQSDNYHDDSGFNFWPIEKICNVHTFEDGCFSLSDSDSYYIFCDYLDFSWAYAINFAPEKGEDTVIAIGTKNGVPTIVAKDFSEFVEIYLRDDDRLYDI